MIFFVDKFMAKYKDINANSMKLLLRQEPPPKEAPVETQKAEDYSEEDEGIFIQFVLLIQNGIHHICNFSCLK